MEKTNKKILEEIIRVDHAGERGAIKIYEGQLLALGTLYKDEKLKKTIEEMKVHEKEHAEFFEKEIKKRNIKPTILLPLWDLLGVGLGFGSAINLGFRASGTKYTLVISPDTEICIEALEGIYLEAERNDNAAIVAPSLEVPELGREIWVMAPDEISHSRADFDVEGAFCTWFIAGAVMLCRTDYFKEIGGFDENIFLYNEDLDLSKRISIAGYAMICVPGIKAKMNKAIHTKAQITK